MMGRLCTRYVDQCPYSTGEIVRFARPDVVEFGKLRRYNDFVIRFLVRLRDQRLVMLDHSSRTPDDHRWLKKLSRLAGSRGDLLREGHLEWWISVPEVLP